MSVARTTACGYRCTGKLLGLLALCAQLLGCGTAGRDQPVAPLQESSHAHYHVHAPGVTHDHTHPNGFVGGHSHPHQHAPATGSAGQQKQRGK
ncbi:MAG: hypothetical protein KatS3mg110_4706 [Pirellulaceae bacterium]|nr:MAG: hypothetical protein KatS3mg110_3691 [Pirellulaceae bacterium]GIW96665.1 MAG: hypothetical protein KatS3mg110_4706 [Pirellulaceae bacterium]